MRVALNIGVDATAWLNNRGYGRHARSLLHNLIQVDPADRYTFIIDSMEQLADIPNAVELQRVQSRIPTVQAAAVDGHRSPVDMWRMSRAFSAPDFDVVLFPTIYSYVPVASRAKKLVMIHDVIAEKFPALTIPRRLPRLLWRAKTALGRYQADAIVTVSEYSRQCLIETFHLSPERVFVAGEASDPAFRILEGSVLTKKAAPLIAALGIPAGSRIIIYVGGFGPHKNLETLVDVFARLASQPEFPDIRLVMVGEYKKEIFYSEYGALAREIEKLEIQDRVFFTGFLPDEDLVVLLNLSTVLVLPSLMEGFGLPAVEAAACGCPVIATRFSPLPDLLGEGGVYFEPNRPAELEGALVRVLSDNMLRQQMRQAGIAAAHSLTWEKAARQLLAIIQTVANQ